MIRLPQCGLVLAAVALLLALGTTAVAAEARGKIKMINAESQELVLDTNTDKDMRFRVGQDAEILINNAKAALRDLQPGDDVVVQYHRQGERLVAVEIRCKR
jgi:hypothetical protein